MEQIYSYIVVSAQYIDISKLSEAVNVAIFYNVNMEENVIAHNLANQARLFCPPPNWREIFVNLGISIVPTT